MGPRRLREGRESATTLPFGEHSTPRQAEAAAQASAPVQFVRREACASVWRRNLVSACVSFCGALSHLKHINANAKVRIRRGTLSMIWCGGGSVRGEQRISVFFEIKRWGRRFLIGDW
ncbi:hypothetical protein AAHE18_16G140900 [Arachis hypogaea]